jgi:hypothetical protein
MQIMNPFHYHLREEYNYITAQCEKTGLALVIGPNWIGILSEATGRVQNRWLHMNDTIRDP